VNVPLEYAPVFRRCVEVQVHGTFLWPAKEQGPHQVINQIKLDEEKLHAEKNVLSRFKPKSEMAKKHKTPSTNLEKIFLFLFRVRDQKECSP
jgi:hypothetical protein